MLRFHKATYLSLLFKFILSERLSNSLLGSVVLLFSDLRIHKYSIHCLNMLMRAYNFNKNKITRSFMLIYFI